MTQIDTGATQPTMEKAPPIRALDETMPKAHRIVRKAAFGGLVGAVPAGVGFGIATATGSRRGGIIAGAAAAAAMIAARWQLQRWFTDEPLYRVDANVGELEIRSYDARVEARTEVETDDFDEALGEGFERLFRYVRGHNQKHEKLAMTVPVTAVRSIDGYRISFVMPPDHPLYSLPPPRDMRVELLTIPEQRIAAMCFSGRHHGGLVARQEAEMVRQVLESGLDTTGEPMFAGYDPPSTLGFLRRNEIWMELV
ncbi:MAG TPA: heme-binding protein [Kofleriaceae bacterium]|nr:heme-binding protein [Kofleriaceae bacterium]